MLALSTVGLGVGMTLLDEPVADAAAPEPVPVAQHRKRRWPWVVGAIILVAAISAVVFAYEWAAHYQPLTVGGFSTEWPHAEVTVPGHVQTQYSYDVTQYGSTFLAYPYKAGYKFGFMYSLSNQGPYDVKVVGVGGPAGVNAVSDPRNMNTTGQPVMFARNEDATDLAEPTRPFTAFVASSGHDTVPVGMSWTYHGCPAGTHASKTKMGAGANFLTTFTVTYKFLWFTHSVQLTMRDNLGLVNIQICE